MLRKGTQEDIPRIVEMAEEFWKYTVYDEEFCPDSVAMFCEGIIQSGYMVVLDIDGKPQGFACGMPFPLLGNASVKTGSEIAWWVQPKYRGGNNGIRLLRYLEKLAKEDGVKYWNMVVMHSSMPASIEGMYDKLGYNKVESVYMRVL